MKKIVLTLLLFMILITNNYVTDPSFADTATTPNTDIITILEKTGMSDSELMKYLNVEIPGEAHVAGINAVLRLDERKRVTAALIQHLSLQQFNKNPKAWVTAVTAKEEYLTGKITIPLLATILIKDLELNDAVPDNFLLYQENSTLKALTINGEIFDPAVIADYKNVILSAREIFKEKGIDLRQGLMLSGAILVCSKDDIKDSEQNVTKLLRDFLIASSELLEIKRLGRELSYREERESGFRYRLSIFSDKPIFMYERDPEFAENISEQHHSLDKILTEEISAPAYIPVIYNGPDTKVEKVTDSMQKHVGMTVKLADQDEPFDHLLAITVTEEEGRNKVKSGDIIGIRRRGASLLAAVANNQVAKLKDLLTTIDNVDILDENENPLLFIAIENRYFEITKLLIEAGAQVNSGRKKDNKTPLQIAVQNYETDIVKLLLDSKANANVYGPTPLCIALDNNRIDIAKLLLDFQADATIPKGNPALHIAASRGNKEFVELMLKARTDPNAKREPDGATALHAACGNNKIDIVNLLIDSNADINESDNSGTTPLILAVELENVYMTDTLLRRGVDATRKNNLGITAYELAKALGNDEIMRLFIDQSDPERSFSPEERTHVLVTYLSLLLDDKTEWTRVNSGEKIFNLIKSFDKEYVIKSFEKNIQNNNIRQKILYIAVKLGIPGSESQLNLTLLKYGNRQMAQDFINSGSSKLAEGGRNWASKNGYVVDKSPFAKKRVHWGEF